MHFTTLVLLASSVTLARSTVFIKAPCPSYKPVPDFKYDLYKGVWYEIGKYPDNWEKNGDCGRIEYYKQNDVFNLSNVVDNKRTYVTGTCRNDKGVLYHESSDLKRLEGIAVIPVNVVAIDYNEYAIMYECIYDEITKMRHDWCWVFTRNRIKKDEVFRKTNDVIKSLGYIDTTKFVWSHLKNENCLE